MIEKVLLVMVALFALLVGWVAVQALARRYATRHPETGPYREAGCSHSCGSCVDRCSDPKP